MRTLKPLTRSQVFVLLGVAIGSGMVGAYLDFDNPALPMSRLALCLLYVGAAISIWATIVLIINAVVRK